MVGLLDLVLSGAADPAAESNLRQGITTHVTGVKRSAGRGKRASVGRAEERVGADPAHAFSLDRTGSATLRVDDNEWSAGRFETPSIGELRARVTHRASSSRVNFWVLDGRSPATDIGSLQATSGDADTLFQVASQFNCLESPGPHVTPVAHYFSDSTQGPRASISAFPATLLRHYAAPVADGSRFVQQSDGPQIDLLADALGPGASPNGYFTGEGMSGGGERIALTLSERFDQIRVGVHDGAEVVLGYNWDGAVMPTEAGPRRIAQVFTSTVAGGMYGGRHALGRDAFPEVCRPLLRGAYFGTLLAAAEMRRRRVVLTMIGGGVFGNPAPLILESINWAMREVEPLLASDMDVILNGYNLGESVDLRADVLPLTQAREGAVVRLDGSGLRDVMR